MSQLTEIQWCDSTLNPIMGCGGCELFPSPREVLAAINAAVSASGAQIDSKRVYKALVEDCFSMIEKPNEGHGKAVSTTNIWHLRDRFTDQVSRDHGVAAATAAGAAIRQAITCYAATLHLNKGTSIVNPVRTPHKGYAPAFERVTRFAGRAANTSLLPDLLGRHDMVSPWKGRLARMIFVSDMGDALSSKADFPFLKSDLMPAIISENGRRHLWLWLTKRPERMARFAGETGGFPSNVCAMTTVTGPATLERIDQLRRVKAEMRGLSIEPLWERIEPKKLDLTGVDWVIVGGESGSGELTRPFAVEWAEELRDYCRKQGVAFFLKQLGRNPSRDGDIFKLKDRHGGDWSEWESSLKIREFPPQFHRFRADELVESDAPRRRIKAMKLPEVFTTQEEVSEFRRLDKIVRKGVAAFLETGKALAEIHDRQLWRSGGHTTWEGYCREVAGMSKPHAHRLVEASRIAAELAEPLPIGNVALPMSESQVRPLRRLENPDVRRQAWASAVRKANGQPTAREVIEAVAELVPDRVPESRPTRSQQRARQFEKLRAVIRQKASWEEAGRLLKELEDLL